MSTKAMYPISEIGRGKVGFSKTRSIIEAPFYGNNVVKINTLREAYKLASQSPGTIITDMPIKEAESIGLERDSKVLLFNDGAVTGRYAVARRILENQNKDVEVFVTYEPSMTMVAEWWKQLFGESEGKEEKGIFPASVTFTTDLHSMGQFIQEGRKNLFETVLTVEKPMIDMTFPEDEENLDNMNYLAGRNLDWVNKMACEGTIAAHVDTGNVPNIIISLEDNTPFTYGYMIYFFFRACAASVLLLDVNPFNQPGVEVYKKNMFKLLGKI